MKKFNKYTLSLISSIFLTIAPLLFSSVLTTAVIAHQNTIATFNYKTWTLISLLSCITATFAFTPPTLLALIFGYFIGWNAVFPILLVNIFAILLVNILTKYIDGDEFKIYLSNKEQVRSILQNIRENELKFIFFTKLSPVLPFALTNFVFALSGAKLKNILLGGFFGMIPRTILAIWTGLQAKEISRLLKNPNKGSLQEILIALLLVSSVGGILYYTFRKKSS